MSFTANFPAKIIPTEIRWFKTSREIPYGPGNSTPWNWDYGWGLAVGGHPRSSAAYVKYNNNNDNNNTITII